MGIRDTLEVCLSQQRRLYVLNIKNCSVMLSLKMEAMLEGAKPTPINLCYVNFQKTANILNGVYF